MGKSEMLVFEINSKNPAGVAGFAVDETADRQTPHLCLFCEVF